MGHRAAETRTAWH